MIIGNTTLKSIGYDLAGNPSSVVERSYVIDSDAPFLGSFKVNDGAAYTNSTTLDITVSAIEATYVKVTETLDISAGTWVPYATNFTYTIIDSADGEKTLYCFFKDDAGNLLGQNGEFKDSIIYDSQTPTEAGIALISPDTPSGSFDKALFWEHTDPEAGISYEIEIHSSSSYSDVVRSGTSTQTQWQVNPIFSAEGTYYWRVRSVDAAGNTSAWVESGEEKSFTLKLYTENYWPTAYIYSENTLPQWAGFGIRAHQVSDAEHWIFTKKGTPVDNSCENCNFLELYNLTNGTVSDRIVDPDQSERSYFGHEVVYCDIDNDGTDELIISAPYAAFQKNVAGIDTIFNNAGAVCTSCKDKAHLTTTDAVLTFTPAIAGSTTTKYFGASLMPIQDLDGSGAQNSALIIGNNSWQTARADNTSEMFIVTSDVKPATLVHDNLRFIAKPIGTAGNSITVTITTNATDPTYSSSCTAAGNDVTIVAGNVAAYGGHYGPAWNIQSAINANSDCNSLVSVGDFGAGGYGSPTVGSLSLSGGIDGTPTLLVKHVTLSAGTEWGANMVRIEDINQDGVAEFAFSAPRDRGLIDDQAGQVIIYDGHEFLFNTASADYPNNAEMIKFFSPSSSYAQFGRSISHKDLDGDGLADFLISAPSYSSGLDDIGAVFQYFVKSVQLESE